MFDNNTNSYYNCGGAIAVYNSAPVVQYCTFTNNTGSYGGGISCIVDDKDYRSNIIPSIIGNEFHHNNAYLGGAIYCGEFSSFITQNYIYDNKAQYGGAMYIYKDDYNRNIIRNNLIYNNKAYSDGGAFYYNRASVNQANNTIVKNQAGTGGAFYFEESSDVQIFNDIIYFNRAGSGPQAFINDNYSDVYFKNCFIQYGIDGITGDGATYDFKSRMQGNFSTDPLFADTAARDFRLSDSSYCINAGTICLKGMQVPETDIEGHPRLFPGTPVNIDAGACEFQGNPKNRKPCIEHNSDQYTFVSERKELRVVFTDPDITDAHTITITTGNANVTVENLNGNTSGSSYDLVPAADWQGATEIYVRVEDDKGNYAIDTFNLIVSHSYCGSITGNMTWEADTVRILCDVTIEKEATLTIMPGTIVEFDEYAQLKVFGRLLAVGSKENMITFTSSDTSGFNQSGYKGWRGIRFYGPNTSDTSKLVYCIVKYAKGKDMGFAYDNCGGGIFIQDWKNLLISKCQICNNSAVTYGGGIYCRFSGVTIRDNIISNNYTYAQGGGIWVTDNYPYTYLINNVICNNETEYYGGGIYCTNLHSINNVIANNRASKGGGLYLDGGSQELYNTIIWGNIAGESPQVYAVYVSYNNVYLYNNLLDLTKTNLTTNSSVRLYNEQLIGGDPQFILPSNGPGKSYDGRGADWSLRASSPCINKGTVTTDIYQFRFPDTDIAGESRILMDTIDIGAFEFRNFVPEKIYEIPDQNIIASIPKELNVGFAGAFSDNNTDDPLTYSVKGINTPQWISMDIADENIMITGTPDANDVGVTEIVVTATDRFNATATDTFKISVLENNPPVLLNKLQDISLHVSGNLNYPVPENSFADPDADDILRYSATLSNGDSLPGWLTFDSKGKMFCGYPQTAGTGDLYVLIIVTDLAGNSITDTFIVSVVNRPPFIQASIPDAYLHVLESFNYTIPESSFADPDMNDVLTYSAITENAQELPGWLTFDKVSRTFSGIPGVSDTGSVSIIVAAADLAGAVSSDTFQITVSSYVTSVKQDYMTGCKIFPVPVKDVFYIEFSDDTDLINGEIVLYNICGNRIPYKNYEINRKSRLVEVNVSSLPCGIYMLNIINKDNVKSFKITKL